MDTVLLKLALAVVFSAGMVALWLARGRLAGIGPFTGTALGFGLFRLIPFLLFYVVLGYPVQSDVALYFVPQAVAAARGDMVYLDFDTAYGPLFPYLLGAAYRFWSDPRSIVVLMMLIEGAAVWMTVHWLRRSLSRRELSLSVLLYYLSPAPLLLVVVGGQEDVWLWAFALPVIVMIRERPIFAGLAALVGLFVTKAFFLMPVIGLIPLARRRLRYVATVFLGGVVLAGAIWWRVGDAMWFALRGTKMMSPPNIWFLMNPILFEPLFRWAPVLTGLAFLSATAGGFFQFHRAARTDGDEARRLAVISGWIFLFCAFMLLNPKSLGNYVGMFLLPVTFVVVRSARPSDLLLLIALNGLASVHPSLWHRLGMPLHDRLPFETALHVVEYGMQVGFVGVLAWALVFMHRDSRSRIGRSRGA